MNDEANHCDTDAGIGDVEGRPRIGKANMKVNEKKIDEMQNPILANLIEHIERQREGHDPLHIRNTGLWPVGPAGLQPAAAPPAHGALESGGTRFRASWTCSLRLRRADGSERSTSLR